MFDECEKAMYFSNDCPPRFCDFIGENYITQTFEESKKMPNNNPGFDWLSKKGEKIDHKGTCLCNRYQISGFK